MVKNLQVAKKIKWQVHLTSSWSYFFYSSYIFILDNSLGVSGVDRNGYMWSYSKHFTINHCFSSPFSFFASYIMLKIASYVLFYTKLYIILMPEKVAFIPSVVYYFLHFPLIWCVIFTIAISIVLRMITSLLDFNAYLLKQ